jgi:hypothetical protein
MRPYAKLWWLIYKATPCSPFRNWGRLLEKLNVTTVKDNQKIPIDLFQYVRVAIFRVVTQRSWEIIKYFGVKLSFGKQKKKLSSPPASVDFLLAIIFDLKMETIYSSESITPYYNALQPRSLYISSRDQNISEFPVCIHWSSPGLLMYVTHVKITFLNLLKILCGFLTDLHACTPSEH